MFGYQFVVAIVQIQNHHHEEKTILFDHLDGAEFEVNGPIEPVAFVAMESAVLEMDNSACDEGEEEPGMREEEEAGEIMADYQAHQCLSLVYQADLVGTYLAWGYLHLDDQETEGAGVGAS